MSELPNCGGEPTMLRESFKQPNLAEKKVKVKILYPLWADGKECAVGEVASMTLSDAQALRSVGRIQFIS
jgi:hypothetical protein